MSRRPFGDPESVRGLGNCEAVVVDELARRREDHADQGRRKRDQERSSSGDRGGRGEPDADHDDGHRRTRERLIKPPGSNTPLPLPATARKILAAIPRLYLYPPTRPLARAPLAEAALGITPLP